MKKKPPGVSRAARGGTFVHQVTAGSPSAETTVAGSMPPVSGVLCGVKAGYVRSAA